MMIMIVPTPMTMTIPPTREAVEAWVKGAGLKSEIPVPSW